MVTLSKSKYAYDLFCAGGVIFWGIAVFVFVGPSPFMFILPLVGMLVLFILGLPEKPGTEESITSEVIKFAMFVLGLIAQAYVLISVFEIAGIIMPIAIFFFFLGIAVKIK